MTTLDEKIKIMQAYKDGKTIEYKEGREKKWKTTTTPVWDWYNWDYRIKEEPKKKVKLYQVLLEYVNNYHISLQFFKTEQEAIYYYDGSGFIVIKLLPHTMIEVEED